MGKINKNRTQIITGPDDLKSYFTASKKWQRLMCGTELEIMFMVAHDGRRGFRLPTDQENLILSKTLDRLEKSVKNNPDDITLDISDEPGAHMKEIKSNPYKLTHISKIHQEIKAQHDYITAIASDINPPQIQSPFAHIPFVSAETCRRNIISGRGDGDDYSERPRTLMKSFQRHMTKRASYYPVTNTAIHCTHGVKSLRHAFEMTKMHMALLPFFFILTENRPPYQNGSSKRVTVHTGIRNRMSLNVFRRGENEAKRGLIPEFAFAARNEQEMIDGLIDTVLNTPMLAYYDHKGVLKPVPKGVKITPANMKSYGPENVSQFELAMSQFWWSFKYKLAADQDSPMMLELRDFDAGPRAVTNVTLITAMLALNNKARADMFKRLETKYGIPVLSDPNTARTVIRKNLIGAYRRGDTKYHDTDRHMQIPFGQNGHTMLDFLQQDLLPMLEAQYKAPRFDEQLENLQFISQTGMTNTQLWYDSFTSMSDQTRKIQTMTADRDHYNALISAPKSWAQHHAEGQLPFLDKKPRVTKNKKHKPKPPS